MSAVATCPLCEHTAFDPERFNAQAAYHVAASTAHDVADRIVARQLLADWIEEGGLAAQGWKPEFVAQQLAYLEKLHDELFDAVLDQVSGPDEDEEDGGLTVVSVLAPIEDHGSIVIFEGATDDGDVLRFAVDHRLAQTLCEGLYVDDDVRVALEDWQIRS